MHEQEREREHLQVVAQIERTDRWLDGPPSTPLLSRADMCKKRACDRTGYVVVLAPPDCCRPIGLELPAITTARQSFVIDTVFQMESSHPDAVGAMLAHAAFMFVVGPDGAARTAGSGTVYWKPRLASAQITEAFAERTWGFPSAAAFAVGVADAFTAMSQPYCAELPAAVLEIVAAEPSSAIGMGYKRYVRSAYLPAAGARRRHRVAVRGLAEGDVPGQDQHRRD